MITSCATIHDDNHGNNKLTHYRHNTEALPQLPKSYARTVFKSTLSVSLSTISSTVIVSYFVMGKNHCIIFNASKHFTSGFGNNFKIVITPAHDIAFAYIGKTFEQLSLHQGIC